MASTSNKPFKLGVALSGGGARGFAHLGVLKAMEERGLCPDILSGTSAGSLIAVFYAAGHSIDEIMEMSASIRFSSIKGGSLPFFRSGFFNNTGIHNLLDKHLGVETFEELKKPVRIVASDIEHGRIKVFSKGPITPAVMASCSVPVVFTPVDIDGHHYVDGGLLMNFPVSVIRKDCEKVIGVNVSPVSTSKYESSMKYVIGQVLNHAVGANTQMERRLCDYLIESPEMSAYSIFDFKHLPELYTLGYEFAAKYLDDNKERLRADFHRKKPKKWRERVGDWVLSLKLKSDE